MRPTKAKDLIPKVATQTGVPEQDLKTLVDLYYGKARHLLSSLSYIRVHLFNLGDFTIKHWLFDEYIHKYENFDQRTRLWGKRKEIVGDECKKNLALILNVKQHYEEEQQRKEFVRLHKRTTYELNKKNKETDL